MVDLIQSISTTDSHKGTSYGTGGGYGVQMNFKKASGSDEYTWGITEKKYNERHAITLTTFNEKGQKGIFNLVNKKG